MRVVVSDQASRNDRKLAPRSLIVARRLSKSRVERAMNMLKTDPGGNDACSKAMRAMRA